MAPSVFLIDDILYILLIQLTEFHPPNIHITHLKQPHLHLPKVLFSLCICNWYCIGVGTGGGTGGMCPPMFHKLLYKLLTTLCVVSDCAPPIKKSFLRLCIAYMCTFLDIPFLQIIPETKLIHCISFHPDLSTPPTVPPGQNKGLCPAIKLNACN